MRQFATCQNTQFAHDLFNPPDDLLDAAVDWIRDNLIPEDVFDADDLADWAYSNGFKKFE